MLNLSEGFKGWFFNYFLLICNKQATKCGSAQDGW